MRYRDISVMRTANNGTRTLLESTMLPEVIQALRDWQKANGKGVLIGGSALSFHAIPRMTQDLDFLYLTTEEIPERVQGFTRIRPHAFQHNKTHVEVEVLAADFLKLPQNVVEKIIETATESDGILIATASGLVVSKLFRLSMRDKADVISLLKTGNVSDLTEFPLPDKQIAAFAELVEIAKTDPHSS